MCEYEGKRYRQLEKFTSGVNGCAQCLCVDGNVNCDESKCQILVEPPETPTIDVAPTVVEQPLPPIPTTTTTTTTTTPKPVVVAQGNEKGPTPADLAYYASRLTDANINAQKGPQSLDAMSYYPEQMQYLQAQGAPGSRGQQGMMKSN